MAKQLITSIFLLAGLVNAIYVPERSSQLEREGTRQCSCTINGTPVPEINEKCRAFSYEILSLNLVFY